MPDDITYWQLTEGNWLKNQHVFAYSSFFAKLVVFIVRLLYDVARNVSEGAFIWFSARYGGLLGYTHLLFKYGSVC